MENKFDELNFVDVEEVTDLPKPYVMLFFSKQKPVELTKEEFEKLEWKEVINVKK